MNLPISTTGVNPDASTPNITELRDTLRELRAALRPGSRPDKRAFTPRSEARLRDVHGDLHCLLRGTPLESLLSGYAQETADNIGRWLRSPAAREIEHASPAVPASAA